MVIEISKWMEKSDTQERFKGYERLKDGDVKERRSEENEVDECEIFGKRYENCSRGSR